jgi:tRNA(His) guanylyltransferase
LDLRKIDLDAGHCTEESHVMDLGDRMKRHEAVSDGKLMRRTPVIGRIDGKAFHTFTRGMEKPFDKTFQDRMLAVCKALCAEIQGCKLGYVQSDEISLLLTDYDELNTDAWFDYRINKMCSVAAGLASAYMTLLYERTVTFDARVFNVPKEDVCNYFIWRQKDAVKNSINMYAQSMFHHMHLQGLHGGQLQELMWSKEQFNWNDAPTINKRGACVVRSKRGQLQYMEMPKPVDRFVLIVDRDIPEFTKERDYIEQHLLTNEEREERGRESF